jgi:hypothetical protein
MQVKMQGSRDIEDARQREIDELVARSRELLSTSKEHRERVDRAVAKSLRTIRRALLESRRGY